MPARLKKNEYAESMKLAKQAHKALEVVKVLQEQISNFLKINFIF